MRPPCRGSFISNRASMRRLAAPLVSTLCLFWIYWLRLNSNVPLIGDANRPTISSTENKSVNTLENGVSSADGSLVVNNNVQVQTFTNTQAEDRVQLEPVRILEEYKQQHSNQALTNEVSANLNHENNTDFFRKYALVTYWCPDRAGNILHNLFNSMAWAIVTNRTILWQYSDNHNTEQDCQEVMKRPDWLPAWEEWSLSLQLEHPDAFPWEGFPESPPQVVIFPQIPDVFHGDKSIDRISWRDDPMQRNEDRERIHAMGPEIAARATSLYAEGVDFLLGLLFRETFELQVGQDPSNTAKGVSITLHSRHPVNGDDGSFVDEEKECLAQLLTKHTNIPENSGLGCHVHLMSDRKATVDLLSTWVQTEFNCTPVIAEHSSSHVQKTEHGPWDGAGFIEDLASASLARTAVVGDTCRSSFMLVAELVDYEQRMDAWRDNRPTQALDICKLQNKALSGYDYGPGTPTFIRHNTRPELAPVKALKEYKKQHSHPLKMEGDREYVIVNTSCTLPGMNGITGDYHQYQFLNNMILAIASNRTILVNKTPGSECRDVEFLHSWIPVYDDNLTLPLHWKDRSDNFSVPSSLKLKPDDVRQQRLPLDDDDSRATAKALFAEGNDFLYGMMFSESFHLPATIQAGIPTEYDDDIEFAVNTIAFQAELNSESSSSSSLAGEEKAINCLKTVLDPNLPCHVYMMMTTTTVLDPKTNNIVRKDIEPLNRIHRWLLSEDRNCTIWSATRYNTYDDGEDGSANTTMTADDADDDDKKRQIQLFRDLHFAAKAKTAYVGPSNAYSDMLMEWMEYRRRSHIWKDGRFPPLHSPNLTKCILY